jgi:hypothetical protein
LKILSLESREENESASLRCSNIVSLPIASMTSLNAESHDIAYNTNGETGRKNNAMACKNQYFLSVRCVYTNVITNVINR